MTDEKHKPYSDDELDEFRKGGWFVPTLTPRVDDDGVGAGTTHFMVDARMLATVDALRAEVERLRGELSTTDGMLDRQIDRATKAEAERDEMAGLLLGGEWRREDERTYLCVRVRDGADLSCRAARQDAIDTALKGE